MIKEYTSGGCQDKGKIYIPFKLINILVKYNKSINRDYTLLQIPFFLLLFVKEFFFNTWTF